MCRAVPYINYEILSGLDLGEKAFEIEWKTVTSIKGATMSKDGNL